MCLGIRPDDLKPHEYLGAIATHFFCSEQRANNRIAKQQWQVDGTGMC